MKTRLPLAGNEGLIEIETALDYLDRQLWPAQNGWSEAMQTAIENLHFHKAQILNVCKAQAGLMEALQNMTDHTHLLVHLHRARKFASPDKLEWAESDWTAARAAIAKATGQLTEAEKRQGADLAEQHGA